MNILRNILLLCCMLLWTTCQNNDVPQAEGGASLSFTIQTVGSISTRGVEDLDDDGTITEEEVIIDGRKMYRLAVYLIDGNDVVASTMLEADDQRFNQDRTEAKINFVNLSYGENGKSYQLYAVANYGNYGDLIGKLASISEEDITSGQPMMISASDDNLCNSKTPYPLTLKQEVILKQGENNVTGKLVRTYARLRIRMRNQSSANDLDITQFTLSSKFTQSSVDVFTEGGQASVSPVVTSTDAITPFKTQTIPKPEQGIESEATIFDSYLLESSGGEYEYTLGFEGKGEDWVSNEYIYTKDGLDQSINQGSKSYLIRSKYNENAYLYDNGTSASVGLGNSVYDANGKLNPDYLWVVTRDGDKYFIKSMKGRFMQSSLANGGGVPLGTAKDNNHFSALTFPWDDKIGVQFKTTNGSYYLSTDGGKACGHTGSTLEFFLYEASTTNVSYEATIPISIKDKSTGVASSLAAIKRNDFINILITVSNSVTGELQYEVQSWTPVEVGNIVFN